MTDTDSRVDILFEAYQVEEREIFQKSIFEKVYTQLKNDIENEEWDKLKIFLDEVKLGDLKYYEQVFLVIVRFKYGKLSSAKKILNQLIEVQIAYKNFHRIEEIVKIAEDCKFDRLIRKDLIKLNDVMKGKVEKSELTLKNLEKLNFNDIKKN